MYNGEEDILKIHLHELNKHVDKFIICEARTTFSGKSKPLYYRAVEPLISHSIRDKTEYVILPKFYSQEEWEIATQSPNTQGAEHWKTEFLQKESIKSALTKLHDDDVCYIGDVDEIWEPYSGTMPVKLKLRVYTYYLDNRSDEEFAGTLVAKYSQIKNSILNHLRSNSPHTKAYYGWHFTSQGGLHELERKLGDSYTEESYFTPEVQKHLQHRFHHNQDFLGRNFTYYTDESEWPKFLKKNRQHFAHLCKGIA